MIEKSNVTRFSNPAYDAEGWVTFNLETVDVTLSAFEKYKLKNLDLITDLIINLKYILSL